MKKNKKKERDWFMQVFVVTMGCMICGVVALIVLSQVGVLNQ